MKWDLNTYCWPKDRVLRWWNRGWDWDSLRKKTCLYPDFPTYGDYYGERFSQSIIFDDPRPGKQGKISEWDYWHDPQKGDRWLTKFSGKCWSPYHLPLYDPNTGEFSPKHQNYLGHDGWDKIDLKAFTTCLMKRMELGRDVHKYAFGFAIRTAPLSGIVVPCNASISYVNGKKIYVCFRNALFGHNVDLSCIKFGRLLDIGETSFGDTVNFSHTNFGIDAYFNDVWFGDYPNFQYTIFEGGHITGPKLSLSRVRFGTGACFSNVEFCYDVDFTTSKKNTVFKNISFVNATFSGNVDFSGLRFTGRTDFHNATFCGLAKFYETELPEETYFTFKDTNWLLPPSLKWGDANAGNWLCRRISGCIRKSNGSDTPTKETSSSRFEEYEKAFCRLKKLHQGHEARTAEHFFYKLELKSRMRRDDIRWTEKWAAGAYGLLSDYGESIGLPLLWLFVSLLIATAVASCAALPFWNDFSPHNLDFAATAAWHNLVPGGFIKDVFSACHDGTCGYRYEAWSSRMLEAYGFRLYFVTGLLAAWNLALWFLLGLALKRRFQIK